MKQLKVTLSLNSKEIGEGDYINLKKDKKKYFLEIEGFRFIENTEIKNNNSLSVKILFNKLVYSEFDIFLNDELVFIDANHIKLHCDSDINLDFYNQDVIEIWKDWEKESNLEWTHLNNNKKKAWLVACLFWSGLPTSISDERNYLVDGALVNSKTDFYCLLGEVFSGKRGYFGQDLDGLIDCVNNARGGSHSKRIVFKNFNILEKNLNKTNNYMELVIDVFRSNGFSVEILA